MPAVSLHEDPSYGALLRALGFEDAAAQTARDNAVTNAGVSANLNREALNAQSAIGRRSILQQRENAGLLRSGYTNRLLAEQEAARRRGMGGIDVSQAQANAGAQQSYTQGVAQRATRRAEQSLQSGYGLYQRDLMLEQQGIG